MKTKEDIVDLDILDYYAQYGIDFPKEADFLTSDRILRQAIFKVFKGKCFYTGEKLTEDNFSIDHIIPKSKGGGDNIYNYVLCSRRVNSQMNANFCKESNIGILQFVRQHRAQKIMNEVIRIKTMGKKIENTRSESRIKIERRLLQGKEYIERKENRISDEERELQKNESINEGKSFLNLLNKGGVIIVRTKYSWKVTINADARDIRDHIKKYGPLPSRRYGHLLDICGLKEFGSFGISSYCAEIKGNESFIEIEIYGLNNQDETFIPDIWLGISNKLEELYKKE